MYNHFFRKPKKPECLAAINAPNVTEQISRTKIQIILIYLKNLLFPKYFLVGMMEGYFFLIFHTILKTQIYWGREWEYFQYFNFSIICSLFSNFLIWVGFGLNCLSFPNSFLLTKFCILVIGLGIWEKLFKLTTILQLTQYSDSVYLHHFDRFINLLTFWLTCGGMDVQKTS